MERGVSGRRTLPMAGSPKAARMQHAMLKARAPPPSGHRRRGTGGQKFSSRPSLACIDAQGRPAEKESVGAQRMPWQPLLVALRCHWPTGYGGSHEPCAQISAEGRRWGKRKVPGVQWYGRRGEGLCNVKSRLQPGCPSSAVLPRL